MGGVYRSPGVTYSARYLDREERYELARLLGSGLSARQVAGRLSMAMRKSPYMARSRSSLVAS
jgi:hypothetical protein